MSKFVHIDEALKERGRRRQSDVRISSLATTCESRMKTAGAGSICHMPAVVVGN